MDRIWIWFADNGNIRKWASEPFAEGTEFLRAYEAHRSGAGVKELEWDERSGAFYADTALGEVCIDQDGDGFYAIEHGRKHSEFGSLEEAKAFIQKNHDRWVCYWLASPAKASERELGELRLELEKHRNMSEAKSLTISQHERTLRQLQARARRMEEALREARTYVVDALEAHEHSDGRDLLARVDAALSDSPASAARPAVTPGLTYGLKLIAEAIQAHFGERIEDYDEDADDTSIHDAWGAFDALEAALQQAPAGEAEGWRPTLTREQLDELGYAIVPKEPTENMLYAYWHQSGESTAMRDRVYSHVRRYWSAMLSAAPLPTASMNGTQGEAEGWRPIATALEFDRVIVSGWQRPTGTCAGYWWYYEDTIINGKPDEHPDALLWHPFPARPTAAPLPAQGESR